MPHRKMSHSDNTRVKVAHNTHDPKHLNNPEVCFGSLECFGRVPSSDNLMKITSCLYVSQNFLSQVENMNKCYGQLDGNSRTMNGMLVILLGVIEDVSIYITNLYDFFVNMTNKA